MEQDILDAIKDKRNNLAYQIETLIQDFTNTTNYVVEKIAVEYQNTDSGLVPRDPAVRISIRLAGVNSASPQKEQN
jgi:PIN domain nuclease of toxin-antitoxin system